MAQVLLVHEPTGRVYRLLDGRRPRARARGLLGLRSISPDGGAYLEPCSSIHMFGMRFAIDVVWLDRSGLALRIDEDVRPGGSIRACRGAHAAVELASGAAERDGLHERDHFVMRLPPHP